MRKAGFICAALLCVGMFVASNSASASEEEEAHLQVITCNTDGSYTCGGLCNIPTCC